MSQESKTPKIEKGGSGLIDKGWDSISGSLGKRRSPEKGELRGTIGKSCNSQCISTRPEETLYHSKVEGVHCEG